MARASILLAAISAQAIIHIPFFLLVLPISINVVLRDGSAGFAVLFVVNKE